MKTHKHADQTFPLLCDLDQIIQGLADDQPQHITNQPIVKAEYLFEALSGQYPTLKL